MSYQVLMPNKTFIGAVAIEQAKDSLKSLGSNALIISGKIVEKSGIVKKLTDVLEAADI